MADLINLRRARKAKAKAEKDKSAAANRITHGTPKAIKKLEAARREQARAALESKKLEGDS